jgi:hypothetical protein
MTTRVIRSYADLRAAFRARVEDLRISRLLVDELAGLPEGYSAKLLGAGQVRGIGLKSLGQLCEGTASMLLLIEDPEALAKIESRLVPRMESAVRHKNGGRP